MDDMTDTTRTGRSINADMGNATGADYAEYLQDEPVTMPLQVSGTITKTQVIFAIGQLAAAVGAVATFLGLGETTWIVRTVRFFQANEAVPVVLVLAWAITGIVLWIRAKRRALERIVMAALVSNRVARINGAVHPKARAAIDEALAARSGQTRREPR